MALLACPPGALTINSAGPSAGASAFAGDRHEMGLTRSGQYSGEPLLIVECNDEGLVAGLVGSKQESVAVEAEY